MAEHVTVSRKYQVVIPKSAREKIKVKPGQKMTAIVKHGHITFVPVLSIDELAERLQGMNIEGYREEVDRY
jgi:AbrB family looped-hinge helix DNA binding protein